MGIFKQLNVYIETNLYFLFSLGNNFRRLWLIWFIQLLPQVLCTCHLNGTYLTDEFNLTNWPLLNYIRCSLTLHVTNSVPTCHGLPWAFNGLCVSCTLSAIQTSGQFFRNYVLLLCGFVLFQTYRSYLAPFNLWRKYSQINAPPGSIISLIGPKQIQPLL